MNAPATDALTASVASAPVEVAPPITRPIRLVTVLSVKGGCGSTFVAAHLAASLCSGQRVCLVDLDLSKGDVAGMLDLHSDRSLNLLLDRMDKLDDALLRGSVDVHPSGLHVLAQPYDMTALRQISADETRQLLTFLRDNYDLVIVDVGSRADVVAMTSMMVADEVLLVSTSDVPSLRDAQRVLGLLHHLDVRPEHVRLVLNKVEHGVGVEPADVAAQLHVPIAVILPDDPEACERADTRGRLVWEVAPHAKLTVALQTLWSALRGETSQPHSSFSWPWSLRK